MARDRVRGIFLYFAHFPHMCVGSMRKRGRGRGTGRGRLITLEIFQCFQVGEIFFLSLALFLSQNWVLCMAGSLEFGTDSIYPGF